MTKSLLLRSLSILERRRQNLFCELQSWTPEQLGFRPSPGGWSALDLLDHLILTEKAVLDTITRNLSLSINVKFSDRCRNGLLLVFMALPVRLRVPESVRHILPGDIQFDLLALRRRWADDRKILSGFLRDLNSNVLKSGVFRHPAGGWATPFGALLFLHSHFFHHMYQLRRLRKKARGFSAHAR